MRVLSPRRAKISAARAGARPARLTGTRTQRPCSLLASSRADPPLRMPMDEHCKGILIAVSAVLSGSVCAVPIRMLGHSNVFTQSLMRSGPCLFTLLVLAAALWGGRTPAKIKSLGWIGVCGCVFLVTQDLAITAGFLLTKVSNVCVCMPPPRQPPPRATGRPLWCRLAD